MDDKEQVGQSGAPGAHRAKRDFWPWGKKSGVPDPAPEPGPSSAAEPGADLARPVGAFAPDHAAASESAETTFDTDAAAGAAQPGQVPVSASPAQEAPAYGAVTEALPVVGAPLGSGVQPSNEMPAEQSPVAPDVPTAGSPEVGAAGEFAMPEKRGFWPWGRGKKAGEPAAPTPPSQAVSSPESTQAAATEEARPATPETVAVEPPVHGPAAAGSIFSESATGEPEQAVAAGAAAGAFTLPEKRSVWPWRRAKKGPAEPAAASAAQPAAPDSEQPGAWDLPPAEPSEPFAPGPEHAVAAAGTVAVTRAAGTTIPAVPAEASPATTPPASGLPVGAVGAPLGVPLGASAGTTHEPVDHDAGGAVVAGAATATAVGAAAHQAAGTPDASQLETAVIGAPVFGEPAGAYAGPPEALAAPAAAYVEAGPDARTFGGRFRAIERLDRGGTAETYRAVDETGALFAVDVLHPQGEAQVQHLRDSMYAVAAVRHPNLPRVFEWDIDATGFFVVREYVEGWDLETLLTRGPLDPLRVARYGAEAALGLAAAHSAGIVHGSVRTADVMVTPQGAVKVLGLGETLPRTLTPADPPAGAYYLAPEQVRGEAPTDCTDLYALGVVLYEAATGTVPFEGPDAGTVAVEQVEREPEPPRRVNPAVPASLDIVILHALRKAPRDRYRTIDEFRQDLDRVGDQIQSGVAPAAISETPKSRMPRWVWVTGLAVLGVLLLGGALGGWLWWRNNMTAVPSVVAMTPDDARTTLARAGLGVGNISYSDKVENAVTEGSVLSQDPTASTWVRRGVLVSIVINGPQKVTVPKVVGKTQAEALNALQVAGLAIGNITSSYNATAPVGQVVSQDPSGAAQVSKGSPVALVISKGPQVNVVPGLVGQEQTAATATLEKAGFKVNASQTYSPTVAAGLVVSQSPAGGTNGKVGDSVALVVSSGPQPVKVPNVVSLPAPTAIDNIVAAGLKVKMTYVTGSGPASPDLGKVISQSPAAGADAKAGDTVTINVAQP